MDLNAVAQIVLPTSRAEMPAWQPGDALLAGGTWLFSEPQQHVRRLIDLTALGWPAVEISAHGLDLAATCTVERVAALSADLPAEWAAAPLFRQCATALLASFKVWKTATIGGNLSLSFPAGAMISLTAALDATVTVWRDDGTDFTVAVEDFVTGAAANVMAPGDVLRAVHLPAAALRGRTALRKIALSPLGRSGAVLVGRRDAAADGGRFTLVLTGSTVKPVRLVFDGVPDAATLAAAVADVPPATWHADAHGAPDWRRAVSGVLAAEIREELA